MDSQKVCQWTVRRSANGQSEGLPMDSQKVCQWTVRSSANGQSEGLPMDSQKVCQWTVRRSANEQSEGLPMDSQKVFQNDILTLLLLFTASAAPLWLLIAALAVVYIASIWEGNPAYDKGSVNPRLYNDYHIALKCAFQKFLGIV